MSVNVFNIQRMCFDDGPGIRTTVFMQGCSLHCPWCANPEGLKVHGIYEKKYECDDLVDELLKDRTYWEKEGGVTFSGGEALLQIYELEPVLKRLKLERIHLAVETSLFVPEEYLKTAAKYIDYFIVDIKVIDKTICRDILGGDVKVFLKNIDYMRSLDIPIMFRIPCASCVMSTKNRQIIFELLSGFNEPEVEIFEIHSMAEAKYQKLGMEMYYETDVKTENVKIFLCELTSMGCIARINNL